MPTANANAGAVNGTKRQPSTSDQSTPQFDDYWNFQSVVFQVEGTLFSVLKHAFLAERTSPFAAMLSGSPPSGHGKNEALQNHNHNQSENEKNENEDLPNQKRVNLRGSSADDPIVLEDTSVKDFRAFLRVLYPSGAEPVADYEDWFGVLRLAHKWEFVEIRTKAITALSRELRFQPPDVQIHLGRRFQVRRWLKAGLVGLIMQKDLEMAELREAPYCFDHECIAKIFYIQSKAWRRGADGDGPELEKSLSGTARGGGGGLRAYVASQVALLFRAEIAKAGFVPRGTYFPEHIVSSDSELDSDGY